MTTTRATSIPWIVLGLPLLAVLYTGSAFAEGRTGAGRSAPDDAGGGAETQQPPDSATGSPRGETTTAPRSGEPEEDSVVPWHAIFELPGSAFVRPTPAGIWGGSLWLETQAWATQWPYVPRTGIGISGSAWVDTGYEKITSGSSALADIVYWVQQGRSVLRVTPTYATGQLFIQAQAEVVGNLDQTVNQTGGATVDTDDLWIRVGIWNLFDVQFGRYQAWEIYHLGMGLDLNTLERKGANHAYASVHPPDFYGLTFAYYRPNGIGDVAVHVFPTSFVRFEALGQVGNDTTNNKNSLGVRPSAVIDLFGHLRLKGGVEYKRATAVLSDIVPILDANGAPVINPDGTPAVTKPTSGKNKLTQWGLAGSLQFVLDPYFELGVNAAQGHVDNIDAMGGQDTEGSYTITSVGGFANAHIVGTLIVGGGLNWTTLVNQHEQQILDPVTNLPVSTKVGYFAHLQAFTAVQYVLAKQLYIKAVVGYARADLDPSFSSVPKYSNTMLSGRLRVMYLF